MFKKNSKLREKLFPMNNEIMSYLVLISQLGLTFISALLIIFFLFLFLDRILNANNLMLIPGIFLGVLAGGYASYRRLAAFFKKEE